MVTQLISLCVATKECSESFVNIFCQYSIRLLRNRLDSSLSNDMGKRYHCYYCNRSFADTPQSRRNHINGVQHKRNRKLHYDSFKDPAVLLAEEASKPPCRRFFSTGSCGFGANCKYSHTNPQLLLAAQAEQASNQSQSQGPDPSLEEWLIKWKKRQKKKATQGTPSKSTEPQSSFVLPAGFPPVKELPPSLIPPPPGGYPELPRLDWG